MQFKKKIAAEFRQNERPDLKGGVVVIFENEVAGWMNELRDPQHWEPGCIAIGENSEMWLAVGGTPYYGAKEWRVIPESA